MFLEGLGGSRQTGWDSRLHSCTWHSGTHLALVQWICFQPCDYLGAGVQAFPASSCLLAFSAPSLL